MHDLDADMVAEALRELDPPAHSLVLIENICNLVCPAFFGLGERAKVVLMAVTEGEDKPLKYPHMFRTSDVLVLTKVDLLPHLDVDVARCREYARRVNPRLEILETSATRGDGLAHGTRSCTRAWSREPERPKRPDAADAA